MTKTFCGVDVSLDVLDAVIWPEGTHLQVPRTAEGIETLAGFCQEHGVELVVMEATGGLERLPFALLWSRGVACTVVNPRFVRRFAEGLGLLEKTDRIDAGLLGRYGETRKLTAQEPKSQDQQALTALVTRLRQLTKARVTQELQMRELANAEVLDTFSDVLDAIVRQVRKLETRIAQLIKSDPLWCELDLAFRQIKGVADRTVACILAQMPEIGALSGKASGKLAGLAPIARDSGKFKGRRRTRGGRSEVRSMLYVIANTVARYNPDFADFRRRLLAAGKTKKAVRIALARKILVRLNAKARDVRKALGPPLPA